jgi:hypothetical protein
MRGLTVFSALLLFVALLVSDPTVVVVAWKPKMPKINVPTIKVPTIKVPTINVPTIKVPTINLPKVNLPKLDDLASELRKSRDDLLNGAGQAWVSQRDAASAEVRRTLEAVKEGLVDRTASELRKHSDKLQEIAVQAILNAVPALKLAQNAALLAAIGEATAKFTDALTRFERFRQGLQSNAASYLQGDAVNDVEVAVRQLDAGFEELMGKNPVLGTLLNLKASVGPVQSQVLSVMQSVQEAVSKAQALLNEGAAVIDAIGELPAVADKVINTIRDAAVDGLVAVAVRKLAGL